MSSWDIEDLVAAFWLTLVVGIAGVLIYCFGAFMFSSGKGDYCYVHAFESTSSIRLKQHVNWQEDRRIGDYPSLPEALAAAKTLGCEVH
jgi:hypothetical protein